MRLFPPVVPEALAVCPCGWADPIPIAPTERVTYTAEKVTRTPSGGIFKCPRCAAQGKPALFAVTTAGVTRLVERQPEPPAWSPPQSDPEPRQAIFAQPPDDMDFRR